MTHIVAWPNVASKTQEHQKQIAAAEIAFSLILGHVPHVFGKLAWIASFRVGATGEYRCAAFDTTIAPEAAGEVIRRSHVRVFTQWLELGLEGQYRDLAQYLSSAESAERILEYGFGLRALIPATASDGEQLLFLSDLEMILGLMELSEDAIP